MTQPIKLLMITHNYPRFEGDYAGIFLSLLAKRLHQFDIEPIILAPHAPGLPEFEIMDDVKVYRFRYASNEEDENIAYHGNMHKLVLGSISGIFQFKSFLNAFRDNALTIIEKENIEIIGGHWLVPAGLVMKPLAKKTGLPMIMSSHGTDIRLMRKYFAVLYKYLKEFALNLKSWTVVSSFLRDGILSMDQRLDNILEILPMPHDETIFYKDATVVRDRNLFVAVTRFTEQKRVSHLIEAFAKTAKQNSELILHLYGTGPDKQKIEQLIHTLGLEKRVSIFDPLPQTSLRTIYNKAHVVILNSFEEGFGLVLSEAMLCGAAVIGTDSGGIKDIIRHEETGLLVPLDNVDSLSEAMQRLTDDDALHLRLSDKGHIFATSHYQSEPLAKRYADIIKSAVNK